MRKVKWAVSLESLTYEDEFEVEDDATDEEIEKMAKEEAFNMIDWWYTVYQRCRVCGCTWDHVCCWWVEGDLCSNCVGEE